MVDQPKDFVIFPGAQTGIRVDRLVAWLPAEEVPMDDLNGNPVTPLAFHVQGMQDDYTILVRDPEDVKAFLLGAWTEIQLVRILRDACADALRWLDGTYNQGEPDDERPKWGDDQEMDDLYNRLGRLIALVDGEPFVPKS